LLSLRRVEMLVPVEGGMRALMEGGSAVALERGDGTPAEGGDAAAGERGKGTPDKGWGFCYHRKGGSHLCGR